MPLCIAVPLAMGVLASGIRHTRNGHILAPAFVGAMLISNSLSAFGSLDTRAPYVPSSEAMLVQMFRQEGIRYVYGSYWVGMGIIFESGGTIVASSAIGPHRLDYDPYTRIVEAARGQRTAFVFRNPGQAIVPFEHYLHEHEISCRKTVIRWYAVYQSCTPFPDVAALKAIIPRVVE